MSKGRDRDDIVDELLARAIREPILIHIEESTLCPACNARSLRLEEYLYEVPYFGKIIMSTGRCSSCGYSFKDVRLAEVMEPRKIIVKVSGERELRMLVAKSPLSSVAISEIGVTMVPGPASAGFITTVEGLIGRFVEVAEGACKTVENRVDREKCYEALDKLKKALEGRFEVTLVICDYDGLSKVVDGENVKEEPLHDVCESLKPEWHKSVEGGSGRS